MVNNHKELETSNINNSYAIGLSLAIASCFFIGISFIIKKKALNKSYSHGSKRASSGGFGYLKESLWWWGLFSS